MADDYFGPAPRRQGWTDIRIIGEQPDVDAAAELIHRSGEVWTDSGNKPVNSQPGIHRRYIRAQLIPGAQP